MTEFYPGNENIDGEKYDVNDEPNDDRRPFKAVLDSGLTRCTTGNKVFGVLKGAVDAGLYVPHSVKRFPGYHRSEEEGMPDSYEPADHKERIFGVHVDTYMTELKEKS